ncbi:unnamed protein product, partial [Prunus brigantina]
QNAFDKHVSLKAAAPRDAAIRASWGNTFEAFEASLEPFKMKRGLRLVASCSLSITTLDSERNKSTFALKCSNEASNASRALSHGARMTASISYLNGAAALRLTYLSKAFFQGT